MNLYFALFIQIVAFRTLGPKNYAVTTQSSSGHVTVECKVRGFSLRSAFLQESLTADLLQDYLDALLDKKVKSTAVNQFRISIDPTTRQLYNSITSRVYSNKPLTKRALLLGYKPRIYQTLPFGAGDELHARAIAQSLQQ